MTGLFEETGNSSEGRGMLGGWGGEQGVYSKFQEDYGSKESHAGKPSFAGVWIR